MLTMRRDGVDSASPPIFMLPIVCLSSSPSTSSSSMLRGKEFISECKCKALSIRPVTCRFIPQTPHVKLCQSHPLSRSLHGICTLERKDWRCARCDRTSKPVRVEYRACLGTAAERKWVCIFQSLSTSRVTGLILHRERVACWDQLGSFFNRVSRIKILRCLCCC